MQLRPLALLFLAVAAGACQSTGESAASNGLTAHVGHYPMAPTGLERPRVGVPPMAVGSDASAGLEHLASDQLATLLVRTDRFDVVERGQLEMLLAEQDLEGIVADGELARPASVRGVDYLLVGKVTNLRTKATRIRSNSGFGQLVNVTTKHVSGGLGAVDVDNERLEMRVDCGVDLRLVDPSTGSVLDAMFSEYTRTDTASAFGVQVLGVGANADADIEMNEDDRGLILRLAFDDALRKMLPTLDRKLMARTRELQAAAGPQPAAASTGGSDPGGAAQDVAAQHVADPAATDEPAGAFCTQCGTRSGAGDAFCGNCGARIGG
jgi:curli biogenesis system outer membrane secretion channel CsgG